MANYTYKFPEFLEVIRTFEQSNSGAFKIFMLKNRLTGQSYISWSSNVYQQLIFINYKAVQRLKNNLIHRMIREYGMASFDLSILDADDDKEYVLYTLCPSYIDLYNTIKTGLNEMRGLNGSFQHTVQSKRLISLKALRRGLSPMIGSRWYN